MKLTLEQTAGEVENVPFHVRVDIVTATIDAGSTFYVPVEVRHKGLEKTFVSNLCGYELSSKRPEALPDKMGNFIPHLINLARLPSYMFIARRAGGIFPVYTIDQEVFATTPGGPVFRHVELAKVREYLTDYLHDAGILGEKGLSDKLHVRGVNLRTLGLRRPVFYLKKRVPGEVEFWAPVFESGDGQHIYTYAANERREAPVTDGSEVLFLRQTVANALMADKRLSEVNDLRPDRLFPAKWDRLKATLTETGNITVKGREMAVFENGNTLLALEERPEEGRFSLFLGKDSDDLSTRVLQDFERRGLQTV